MKDFTKILCIFSALILALIVNGDETSHTYEENELIPLWSLKVGPYHNSQETYKFDKLPWCLPAHLEPLTKSSDLGEALIGNQFINSGIEIRFKKDVDTASICSSIFSYGQVIDMSFAISNHYWYSMELDGLPIMDFVGELGVEEEEFLPELSKAEGAEAKLMNYIGQAFMYSHFNITIDYNDNQVIAVSWTSDALIDLGKTGAPDVTLTYSVTWRPTEIAFEDRFDSLLEDHFFEHEIHWFSLFNSFMMVFFLITLVTLILIRILRKDMARYAKDEESLDSFDRAMSDDSGWKAIHGDVFRKPRYPELYAAVIGSGIQLALLVLSVIVLSMCMSLYVDSGSINTVFVIIYALTSFVSGYVSGGTYSQKSPNWITNMVFTCCLFPLVVFGVSFTLNFISIYYGTQNAIPFGTMVLLGLIWLCVSVPLTIVGTIVGRNYNGHSNIPCRINSIPRPIPPLPWYLGFPGLPLLSGLMPFGCIFIEIYFILSSFWNYRIYYVYGFMFLVFIIVLLVTVCVSIVGCYARLNSENYYWQWNSFISGAFTAVYVYLYSIYYFFTKTNMTGFLQVTFYFSQMSLFCFGLALLCGAIGNRGTSAFVKLIYKNIKID